MWQRILSQLGPAAKAAKKTGYKRWQCLACNYIYDEAEGWPDDGIPAGTRWQDVSEDWVCPECGAEKADFEMIQIR